MLRLDAVLSGTEKVTEAYTVLKGHRSIVNHVRYARTSQMVISCGVEKIIKVRMKALLQS